MKAVILLEMLVEPGKALSQPWMMAVGSRILKSRKKKSSVFYHMTTETEKCVIF
jgi:hypothetical protein